MIQIISYRTYETPEDTKTTDKWVTLPDMPDKLSDVFNSLESILQKIDPREHYDLHYTLASCYSSKRSFKEQRTWAIDIDGCDASKWEAYYSIVAEATQLDPACMSVVSSGGGLHFVWETLEPWATEVEHLAMYKPAYKELCRRIDLGMKAADLTGTVDAAIIRKSGTLRLPMTMNRKYMPHRPCSFIKRDMIPVAWDIEAVVGVPAASGKRAALSFDEAAQFPKPHASYIKENCGFIKQCYQEPHTVKEPQWYAALSIVARFPEASTEAHMMSKGHMSYSWQETEDKLKHAYEDSGPFTCDSISMVSDKCRECPHFGKIKSPIQLKGDDFIGTKETGFWFYSKGKDGELKKGTADYDGLLTYFDMKHPYVVMTTGAVYVWKGKFYEVMTQLEIEAWVSDVMNPTPHSSVVGEFVKRVFRRNLRKPSWMATSSNRRLNLQNGVLNLETMSLEPHSMQYFFEYVLDYSYDPSAKSPLFDKFMKDITCGDESIEKLLLEFMGYAFSGMEYVHHKALILVGDGSNGKSTFLEIIRALARGAYSTVSLGKLDDEVKRRALVGKLFNVTEETPRKALLDSTDFKNLTAGGEYDCRYLYENSVSISDHRTKFMMACNELPMVTDFTAGMNRRMMIVPFKATFGAENLDRHLGKKLKKELSGILNRVIEGYRRLLMQDDFSLCKASVDATKDHNNNSDTVATWIEDKIEFTGNEKDVVIKNDLYKSYRRYAADLGMFTVSLNKFTGDFARRCGSDSKVKKIGGISTRVFSGVRLRDSLDMSGPRLSQGVDF